MNIPNKYNLHPIPGESLQALPPGVLIAYTDLILTEIYLAKISIVKPDHQDLFDFLKEISMLVHASQHKDTERVMERLNSTFFLTF